MGTICPKCQLPIVETSLYDAVSFKTIIWRSCGHHEFITDLQKIANSTPPLGQLNIMNQPPRGGQIYNLPPFPAANLTPADINNANFGLSIGAVMPTTQRMNYKDAVAKLGPIAEQIENDVFLGQQRVQLVGPGVRDAILGGINSHYLVIETTPNKSGFFNTLWQRHLEQFQPEKDSPVCKIETRFGPVTFELVEGYTAHWDFDRVSYSTGYVNVDYFPKNKIATLYERPKNAIEAQAELQYANEFCQKYGWTISTQSLQVIANVIEADKPFPQEQFVVGFRAYNIENGYLQGAARHRWPTSQLSVDCPDFHAHIKDVVVTDNGYSITENGGTVSHSCGIYIYKDPVECAQFYGIGKNMSAIAAVVGWGDFWEGERGWRVEHARIEKLWVIRDNVQLRSYDIPGGVIMNAKLGDFYKDIYGTGIDWSNERSLI